MKPKTDHSYCFKFLALSLLTLATSSLAIAQTRPPQNIRRVTVTSQYVFENGKKTDKFWAIYQEIYDSLGRLHTEIEWDFTDHYPHNYIWHTFMGMQKVKSEIFKNEKLQMIKEFTYNRDSLISQEIIKMVKPGDTSTYMLLSYSYNQLRNPILIEAKTKEGKSAYKIKSTYDAKGTEVKRSVKVKSNIFPLDSIVKLTSNPLYDSLGRLSKNIVSIIRVDKTATIKDFRYSYDSKNNITGIAILDSKGKQISREERIFQPSRNRLVMIKRYDSSDKLIIWLEKRFEIYRNKDRRQREIDY